MKKFLPILLVIILLGSTFGAVAVPQTPVDTKHQESVTLSSPHISIKSGHTSVFLAEADTYLNNPGRPILPVIIKTYTYPIGTIIESVECIPQGIEERFISKPVEFAQKSVPLHVKKDDIKPISIDDAIYTSNTPYPTEWYTYTTGVGLDGDKHVLYLTIRYHPVRYYPTDNKIKYSTSAEIEVDYCLPESPGLSADDYDLMIIAPKSFTRKLQTLVDHKQAMGLSTKLVTTEEIYATYDGQDAAEKVKYFIEYAVEQWGVTYVLLFGGMKGQRYWNWHVPIRYTNLDDASDWETSYLSDLYFADVYKYSNQSGYTFDDWDSNGNDVFAEWNTDNKDVLDLYPDVYVGRLPVRYRYQVSDIVDRIITYERSTYGSEWFNQMVVIGGDSFDDISWNTSTDYIEGQEETAHALSFMEDFNHTRIWVEGGDIAFTPLNTETELSKGAGFVLFSGHGNPASWATHPHADFDTWIDFGTQNIKNLTNGDKLPVLLVGGCHNSQFDTSLIRLLTQGRMALYLGEFVPKCWSWLFASYKNGGSIASIGCTGLGYGSIGDGPDPPDEVPQSEPDGIPDCIQYMGGWIEGHFYEVYNHMDVDILGQTHGTTITDYLNEFPINWEMDWDDHEHWPTLVDVKTAQEWFLMGDPSLKIGGYQ